MYLTTKNAGGYEFLSRLSNVSHLSSSHLTCGSALPVILPASFLGLLNRSVSQASSTFTLDAF